jgi:hypothetical protein
VYNGAPGLWLSRYVKKLNLTAPTATKLRASDVWWSWVESSIRSGYFSEDPASPIKHSQIQQNNWGAYVSHRCGWRLGIGGALSSLFVSLSDRVLD